MKMGMVHVRNVRVRVPHPTVLVEMRMRLARGIQGAMYVAMMLVMHMRVRMAHRLVKMLVFMMFGEV